jgi:hypothetical protein
MDASCLGAIVKNCRLKYEKEASSCFYEEFHIISKVIFIIGLGDL